jgi:hypothetical protein
MSTTAAIPQPIPYQGSKRQLAEKILRWLPDVDIRAWKKSLRRV